MSYVPVNSIILMDQWTIFMRNQVISTTDGALNYVTPVHSEEDFTLMGS